MSTATQTVTELKPRYCRLVLKKQDNRVEYRILSSEETHYYVVQLANGRAINCYHEDGTKCQARHFHPGVPCSHMQRANQLEQERRMQMQLNDIMGTLPEEAQEVIKEEQAKCQQVWQEHMAAPIDAEPRSKKWYRLAKKREQEANAALNKQRTESQRIIDAAIAAHSYGNYFVGCKPVARRGLHAALYSQFSDQ